MEESVCLPFPSSSHKGAPRYEDTLRLEEDIAEEDERRWAVARAFFDHRKSLAADHITSYNSFVETGIHDMFREADEIEVESEPVENSERGTRRKVVIRFLEVELDVRPEVEKEDRLINQPQGLGGEYPSKGGDDGEKGTKWCDVDSGKGGKVNWFVNSEGPGSSGTMENDLDGDCVVLENIGKAGDEDSGNADGGALKGKEKLRGRCDLNVGAHPTDLGPGGDGDASNEWGPPGDPPGLKGDAMEIADDDPSKWGVETEPMDVESMIQSTLTGMPDSPWGLTDDATLPASPAKASKTPVETNGCDDGDAPIGGDSSRSSAKTNGGDGAYGTYKVGKSGGRYSHSGPSSPSFIKPTRQEPNLTLLPVEARLRGITYASPIYVKVSMETFLHEPPSLRKSSKSSSAPESVDREEKRLLLGRIPVMVKSSLCHLDDSPGSKEKSKGDCCLDPGGYFIIKGSEKVIVAQEERILQRLWVSCMRGVWTAICTPRKKGFTQYSYQRTVVKLAVPKKTGVNQSDGWPVVTVTLPGVEPLPMGIVFSALGVSSDREALQMICYDLNDSEMLQTVTPSLLASDHGLTGALKEWDANTFDSGRNKRDKEVALFYIGSKTAGRSLSEELAGQDVLDKRLLPHFGKNERSKALFVGYMIRTVCLCYLGRLKGTDKDDFKNKRLEFAGEIISHHFRKLMGQVINIMKKRIQKHLTKGQDLQALEKYLDDKVVTRGLKAAFSSGNWRGHDALKTSGIVFDLKRFNPISTLCQLREFRQFVPPTTRVGEEARYPTFSQWGRVCPIDTPDGESCGLVKNMALTGMVSHATPEDSVLRILADSEMEELSSLYDLSNLKDLTKIFLNGRWIGTLKPLESAMLIERLRKMRQMNTFGKDGTRTGLTQLEVVADIANGEVHIVSDGGRVLRPLLIVKDQRLLLSDEHVVNSLDGVPRKGLFDWLLWKGVLEFLGAEEEEKAMIALHGEDIHKAKEMERLGRNAPRFTHAEIHPALILGLSASVIPFPNRNQSARNLYQAHKHCKQAIGFYVTNITSRADTAGHRLFYPQIQLVKTNTGECLGKEELFSGQNAIVAIACYTGYNQEDSLIMGQSSLDRGMFRTVHYRNFRAEERSDHEIFGKPSETDSAGVLKQPRSLEKLDEDGLPGVGLKLGVGDVIVGKIGKVQSAAEVTTKVTDTSQRLKPHEKGRVDQVVLVEGEDGAKVAKVKLRESRMPQVGDKFSSMHGQKGVIGMVFTQEDLPFTKEGIVPDIIINPHAFPSRQTLGQMCESALGKAVAKSGERVYATPFNPTSTVESISDTLHKSGYERWGTETLYNGFTGQPMQAKIFIGTTFYQRLDHMVDDKIKYRSRGHVHPLTRQPVSDRKRHGGVKFGEMERDCMIAHGAAATLQERCFILSDFHTVHLCTGCEQLANWNAERIPVCRHCSKDKRRGSTIVKVELPYACKLLIQELMSMGISVRLKTAMM